jgi:hypothetical protein
MTNRIHLEKNAIKSKEKFELSFDGRMPLKIENFLINFNGQNDCFSSEHP